MRGWRVIRDRISEVGRGLRRRIGHPDIRSLKGRNTHLENSLRSSLGHGYPSVRRELAEKGNPTQGQFGLENFEAGCYSQNGEDGCLLEILKRTGFGEGIIVEIGCGAGHESNAALLVCEFGWRGVLVDADSEQTRKADQFYSSEGVNEAVQIQQCMVTPESVDSVISGLLGKKIADVISIDVDGWDFWIWQALEGHRPAVFVVEVNASMGPRVSASVPYKPAKSGHDPFQYEVRGWHHGASIRAMCALGESRGYQLVHVESTGTNAFFVRGDLMGDSLVPMDPVKAWKPHGFRTRRHTASSQEEALSRTPLVEIQRDGRPLA